MSDESDAVVTALEAVQEAIERLARSQRDFQREAIDLLQKIEASVASMSGDFAIRDIVDRIESDVAIVAHRYRPSIDDDDD
jgi:hypothetical protein